MSSSNGNLIMQEGGRIFQTKVKFLSNNRSLTSFPGCFVRFYVSLTDIGNLASGFNPEEDPRGAIDTGKAVTNKWI